MHVPRNVHPAVYLVVSNKLATYNEIRNMSIDDFINIYEIAMVSLFNKAAIMSDIKQIKK